MVSFAILTCFLPIISLIWCSQNVNNSFSVQSNNASRVLENAHTIKYPVLANGALSNFTRSTFHCIDVERMKKDLEALASHYNRYYKSPMGRAASEWLFVKLKTIANLPSGFKISVQKVVHPDWPQLSIRVRIDNKGKAERFDKTKERIVLSAHIDSTNSILPMLTRAPGADDDGSGTVTQLEVLRILVQLSHIIKLRKPIEFHFYSAEEGGLLGSKDIVQYYKSKGLQPTILHIDMDGYLKKNSIESIGLLVDNTDPSLSGFVHRLIRHYTDLPVKETTCGYACSDHYSWHSENYPVAALFEGAFHEMNPYVHSSKDTVEKIDFDHIKNFAKVALAFAIHLAI